MILLLPKDKSVAKFYHKQYYTESKLTHPIRVLLFSGFSVSYKKWLPTDFKNNGLKPYPSPRTH
jgi:hypothetical protein